MDDPKDWRMDAYYYGFASVGNADIDRILSAVACAGKAFHHTQEWCEDASAYEHLEGTAPVDWIQNAAAKAATRIESLSAMLRECVEALEYYTQYACPICGGDCSAANPPIAYCPPQVARTALTRAQEMLK